MWLGIPESGIIVLGLVSHSPESYIIVLGLVSHLTECFNFFSSCCLIFDAIVALFIYTFLIDHFSLIF